MLDSIRANVRTALLGIAPVEARLDVRGFAATTPDKQQRLEDAGRAFIHGYLIALSRAHPQHTAVECDLMAPPLRGFCYEGAAMGLTIIDLVTRGTPRLFRSFVDGPANQHIYMAHVGAGWALARCPWGLVTFVRHLDPLWKWLAIDGLGFHEAFFHPVVYIERRRVTWKRSKDPEVFDNGLGRAIWFAAGARSQVVTRLIAAFPRGRQAALWSGIGLAATYAGGATPTELEELLSAAGEHRDELAVGSALAAKARTLAGNPTDDTTLACKAICGFNLASAAALTDECLRRVPLPYKPDSYHQWRELIKSEFARRPNCSTDILPERALE